MSYENDLDKIYDHAVSIIDNTDKQIESAYVTALENIEEKIAKYRQDIATGKITESYKDFRAQELYYQINNELTRLSGQTSGYIKRSWNNIYIDTYYNTGYLIEKQINTVLREGANIFINYPVLNTQAMESAFNTEIAGMLFKDRTLYHRRVLQFKVREAAASAIAEGIPVKEFTNRLDSW